MTVLIYHSVRVARPFSVVEAWLLGRERGWMAGAVRTAFGAASEEAAGCVRGVRTGAPEAGATALTVSIGCDLGGDGAVHRLGGQLEAVWIGVNETQLGIVLSSGEPDRDIEGAMSHDVLQRAMCDLLERLASVILGSPQRVAGGGDGEVETSSDRPRPWS